MGVNRQTLDLYWEQVKKYKPSFFTALIAIPLASLLIDTLLPFFFSQAIGGLTANNQAEVTRSLIVAGLVGFIGVVINYIGFQSLVRHEADIRVALSDSVFKKLINKDMRFFVNEKVGGLTSRYIDFVRSHVTLQDLLIIRTLGFVISVGTGLVIVATQSLLLAAVLLLLITLILLQVKWSIKKREPWRQTRKKMTGEIHGRIADALTNNLIVKTFAGEKYEVETLSKTNKDFRDIYVKDIGFLTTEGSARVLAMTITQLIALSICASLVFSGHMTIAIAVFILTYLQRIASQLFTLGEMLNGYDQALLEAAPMTEILNKPSEILDKPNALELKNIVPSIELRDIRYHYEDDADNDIIKGINLTINPGEKIGLVGHSGAGKTTMTHLLLRFSDVTSGAVLIGGNDVRDVTQSSLRKHIAFVPQEPKLFHRSLRDNIAYDIEATDEMIENAARQANALEFINKMPNKFDTMVGEGGVKLSGGQRQRIAIARAILKNAPILFLDEATSALDSESEKLIQDALETLMKGRTSIVIAHRLSTIASLDRIVILENGLIAEQGTHQELLNQKGIYAKLWSHQSGGFIED
ncbi:MAG TPA: ABC transporter ATP-binding protein [Candidatus Saccharimonadales bacterium]|nr:ABC transporter ATP-binding protein [Candidatus Saccharimonadales bacterium]